jgi:hypothetical protein
MMNPRAMDWLLESQNAGGGADSRMSDVSENATITATTVQTTPSGTTGCLRNILKAEFELIATYLANTWVPEQDCTAFDKIYSTVKNFAEPQADQQTTANTICMLQEAVQQLSSKVDNSTHALQQKPLYAAVAGKATSPFAAKVIEKPVLGRHKREIIVSRERHTDICTNCELTKQLNNTRKREQMVAVQGLPSGDLILITDEEQTRTEWLRNTE